MRSLHCPPPNRTAGQRREESPCVRTPLHKDHCLAFRDRPFCSPLAGSVSNKAKLCLCDSGPENASLGAQRGCSPHRPPQRPFRETERPALASPPGAICTGPRDPCQQPQWKVEAGRGSRVPSSTLLLEAAEETGWD